MHWLGGAAYVEFFICVRICLIKLLFARIVEAVWLIDAAYKAGAVIYWNIARQLLMLEKAF